MAVKPLGKKVYNWKIPQGFLKKTQGFDKKPQCFGGYKPQLPYTKIAWGYPVSKRGFWDFEQHELSLKNWPENHEFCVFGIHIEH